ncbi:hypothetical protein ACIBKY_52110 [Nonomuraea sp. NPDC050394]|uniref:hypothetical protein n=1 Tax=Nonomuraea sp. NPDC050394 TaxID=3364363 RepID=UPI0037A04F84
MADDDTTTDDTTQDDTTTGGGTSQSNDDLAGLKSALAAEREQRKTLEKQAKANSKAAEELEKLKAAAMSDQEKAVAAAKAEGATEASKTFGAKLAATAFRAALAEAGLKLGDAADLIDTTKFVTDDGDVDESAIKKAVDRLAKLAPKTPPSSGGDFGGGNGSAGTSERPKNLREAYARTNK